MNELTWCVKHYSKHLTRAQQDETLEWALQVSYKRQAKDADGKFCLGKKCQRQPSVNHTYVQKRLIDTYTVYDQDN